MLLLERLPGGGQIQIEASGIVLLRLRLLGRTLAVVAPSRWCAAALLLRQRRRRRGTLSWSLTTPGRGGRHTPRPGGPSTLSDRARILEEKMLQSSVVRLARRRRCWRRGARSRHRRTTTRRRRCGPRGRWTPGARTRSTTPTTTITAHHAPSASSASCRRRLEGVSEHQFILLPQLLLLTPGPSESAFSSGFVERGGGGGHQHRRRCRILTPGPSYSSFDSPCRVVGGQ